MDFTSISASRAIESEIATNLTAPIRRCEAALPQLLQRAAAAIVNVTSGLAVVPKRSAPMYCATKAGLRAFHRVLGYQLSATPVRVVEALPPMVDTAMTRG